MRSNQFLAAAALCIAAVLPAQNPNVVLVTDGVLGSSARPVTAPPVINTVPGGTAIGGFPNTLDIRAKYDTGVYLSTTTLAYPVLVSANDGRVGVNYFGRSYARGSVADACGSTANPNGTLGGAGILATFSDTPGETGVIRFSFRCSAAATQTVGGSIDIGNDGLVESSVTAGAQVDFPVTFPASGQIIVRLGNNHQATGTGNSSDFVNCWTELQAFYQRDQVANCTLTSYGQGCGGVSVAGNQVVLANTRVFNFVVSGCFPNDPVLAVTGFSQLNLPLSLGCSLLCTVEQAQILMADASGTAVETITVPATMVGTAYHQYVPFTVVNGNLVIRTSDGLQATCTP